MATVACRLGENSVADTFIHYMSLVPCPDGAVGVARGSGHEHCGRHFLGRVVTPKRDTLGRYSLLPHNNTDAV